VNYFATREKINKGEHEIISISDLKEHEKTHTKYLEKLQKQIFEDGVLKLPILVDKETMVVLDGHHRLNSLRKLGFSKIAVVFIDYISPEIVVSSWRKGYEINKKDVLTAGLTDNKFPHKTSRHLLKTADNLVHISEFVKKTKINLEELK